jgi:hypothetical protein
MTATPPNIPAVFAGADTHADRIHVAALDSFGR